MAKIWGTKLQPELIDHSLVYLYSVCFAFNHNRNTLTSRPREHSHVFQAQSFYYTAVSFQLYSFNL